jgi:hypothetical protein
VTSVRAASNATWLAPGACLDRYDLLLQVAEGGMGLLWLARQQGKHGFDRIVAIKTILPRLASDGEFQRMFLDEARVVSRIEHPNVAQVLDLGEERGVLFLVMEWIDGESLDKVDRAFAGDDMHAQIPIGVLTRIMADTCAGLHAAHEIKGDDGLPLGVVHRDISPHNLLVGFRGTTKVIDFGIAKARNRIAHDTSVGLVKGKVAYMAPEQALGAEVDRRTDVWSVGATMYRYLVGHVPYDAPEPIAMLRRLTEGLPPARLPASVPAPIRLVVERALELDPGKRFATARDMGAALANAMLEADVFATHEDVAAFMGSHLGEGRATRSQQIEHAVRESRARMRIGVASTDMGIGPAVGAEVGSRAGESLGLERGAGGVFRPSGRPTVMVGTSQRSVGSRETVRPPPDVIVPGPGISGVPRKGTGSTTSVPLLLRVWRQASRPHVRWAAGACLLSASLVGGLAWDAARLSRSPGADDRAESPPPVPAVARGIGSPPTVAPAIPSASARADLPAADAPTPDLPTPDPTAVVSAFARPNGPQVAGTRAALPSAPDLASSDDLLERARHARRAGRNDDAAALFAAAIAKAPTDSEALTGLAEVDAAQGALPGAIALYRRAMAANPRYLPARLGLADSLWAIGQRADARAAYRSIVAQVPASLCPDRARERAAGTEPSIP